MRRQGSRVGGRDDALTQRKGTARSDDLVSLMRDLVDDEKAGANASLGFTYQHWWAAQLAVERFSEMQDYLIILEFKEDIAIINSATTPTSIEFHQIKKNEQSGVWSMADLLANPQTRTGKPTLSTISKLFKRRRDFHPHPTTLLFVSNVGFKFSFEAGAPGRFSNEAEMSELSGSELTKIRKEVALQLGAEEADLDFNNFRFYRTGLPLESPQRFVSGTLSELSDRNILPFPIRRPILCAKMLATEFARAAGSNSYATSFKRLQKRGVSRAQVADILVLVEQSNQDSSNAILQQAIERIDREMHDFEIVEALRGEVVRVCADLTDRTNVGLRAVCRTLAGVQKASKAQGKHFKRLGEYMEALVATAEGMNPNELGRYTLSYLNCLALLVIKDANDIAIFTASIDTQQKAEK